MSLCKNCEQREAAEGEALCGTCASEAANSSPTDELAEPSPPFEPESTVPALPAPPAKRTLGSLGLAVDARAQAPTPPPPSEEPAHAFEAKLPDWLKQRPEENTEKANRDADALLTEQLPKEDEPTEAKGRDESFQTSDGLFQDAAAEDAEGDLSISKLSQIAETKRFVIGLIGYPAAGKTWFLCRLKDQYKTNRHARGVDAGVGARIGQRAYIADPSAPRKYTAVEGTPFTKQHLFTPIRTHRRDAVVEDDAATQPDAPPPPPSDKSFSIIDIPGERLERALETESFDAQAEALFQAIRICHALILVLPSRAIFRDRSDPDFLARKKLLARQRRDKVKPRSDRRVGAVPSQDYLESKPELVARREELLDEVGSLSAQLDAAKAARKGAPAAVKGKLDKANADLNALDIEIETLDAWLLARDDLNLDDFTDSIVRLSVSLAILKQRPSMTVEQLLGMSDEEFSSYASEASLSRAPFLYVALSKGDALFDQENPLPLDERLEVEAEGIDEFPETSLEEVNPDFVSAIRNHFAWHKFDFLTAFKGQDEAGTEGNVVDYDKPAWGINGVIDWIGWAERYARSTGRIGKSPRWRYWVHLPLKLVRWRWMEGEIARAASGSVVEDKWLGWLARGAGTMLNWSRGKAFAYGIVVLLAIVALGSWHYGFWSSVSRPELDAFKVVPKPRYPIELNRMVADDPAFATGLLPAAPDAWPEVPRVGAMFASGNPVARADFLNIFQQINAITSPQIPAANGASLIASLGQAAVSEGQQTTRTVVSYHTALVQLRMGRYAEAAASFADAATAAHSATAANAIERNRQLGVENAANFGQALALLRPGAHAPQTPTRGDVVRAEGLLATISANIVTKRAQLRAVDDTRGLYPFATSKTAAPLDTAAVWAALAAARIRLNAQPASGDKNDWGQKLGELIEQVKSFQSELDRAPVLAANLQIAASRLGANLDLVRSLSPTLADSADGGDAARVSREASDIAGDESIGACTTVWCVTGQWRRAFAEGAPGKIRTTRERLNGNKTFTPEDVAYLDQWRSDVLTVQRNEPGANRRTLIADYGDMFRGSAFWQQMIASAGGWIWGIWLPLLLVLLALRFVWLLYCARQVRRELHRAKHYEDRGRTPSIKRSRRQ